MALPHLMWWSRKLSGSSRVVRLEPERDFTEFDGQWVEIDAVDAGPDHVSNGRPGRP
jgi:hypothetical protein